MRQGRIRSEPFYRGTKRGDCERGRASRLAAWGLFCVTSLFLSGCATGAVGSAMVPEPAAGPACSSAGDLSANIVLGSVGGGSHTRGWDRSLVSSESLAEALRMTLAQRSLLSPNREDARYRLDVFLVELNQPAGGYTTEVVSFIRYKLVDSDERIVYDAVITASYTLSVSDVFYGVKRMRLASEGSVRRNIGMFASELCSEESADESAAS
jgi:hypothetical protein